MEIVISMNALCEETKNQMHYLENSFGALTSAVCHVIRTHVKSVWVNETGVEELNYVDDEKMKHYIAGHINSAKSIEWLRQNECAEFYGVLSTLGTELKLQVVENAYTPRNLTIVDWKFINEE